MEYYTQFSKCKEPRTKLNFQHFTIAVLGMQKIIMKTHHRIQAIYKNITNLKIVKEKVQKAQLTPAISSTFTRFSLEFATSVTVLYFVYVLIHMPIRISQKTIYYTSFIPIHCVSLIPHSTLVKTPVNPNRIFT